MAKFLKYLIYIFVIIALYIVGKGIYDGDITSSTTLGEMATQVDDGAKTLARDAANGAGRAINDVRQTHQHQ